MRWSPSIEDQPEVDLHEWQVMRAGGGTGDGDHFVGAVVDGTSGRVSSRVIEFDPATRVGITRSGRRYRLVGPPGASEEALEFWRQWAFGNGVDSWTDVSEEYERNNPAQALLRTVALPPRKP